MFIPALIEEFLKAGEGASIADAVRRRTAKRTEAIREQGRQQGRQEGLEQARKLGEEQVLRKFLELAEAEGDPETIEKARKIVAEIRRNG